MELRQFFDSEFEEHVSVAAETQMALYRPFEQLVSAATNCIQSGGKILLFGNGGSAADCQHLATELTIRYKADRDPIAAIALTTDTSALTAGGNDIGFENIFARRIFGNINNFKFYFFCFQVFDGISARSAFVVRKNFH